MNRRRETLEEICGKFGIVTLYSFGSQAQMVKEWLVLKKVPADRSTIPKIIEEECKKGRTARMSSKGAAAGGR